MNIAEHDCVVLTQDLPTLRLKAGDLGAVVHIHGKDEAYEVEFTTVTGKTVAVATILGSQLRAVTTRDVSHVRELEVTP